MKPYMKAVVAFFTLLGTWGGTALLDSSVTPVEWFGLTGVVAGTLAVFEVKNTNANPGN